MPSDYKIFMSLDYGFNTEENYLVCVELNGCCVALNDGLSCFEARPNYFSAIDSWINALFSRYLSKECLT